jgi:hypothetical protein
LVSPVTPFQTVIGATSPGGEVSAVAFLPVAFVARAGKLLFDRSLYALAAWQVALPKLRFCKPCFSHFGCLLIALFGLVKMLVLTVVLCVFGLPCGRSKKAVAHVFQLQKSS